MFIKSSEEGIILRNAILEAYDKKHTHAHDIRSSNKHEANVINVT